MDGASQVATAQANAGGAFYASTLSACECVDDVATGVAVFAVPSSDDLGTYLKSTWQQALHEYVHVFQKAAGGSPPAWIMEGGATLCQCAFGARFADSSSMEDCLR
jgi:hypothetical protein